MQRAGGQEGGRHLTRAGVVYTSWALFIISPGFRGNELTTHAALITGCCAEPCKTFPGTLTSARHSGRGGGTAGLQLPVTAWCVLGCFLLGQQHQAGRSHLGYSPGCSMNITWGRSLVRTDSPHCAPEGSEHPHHRRANREGPSHQISVGR